MSSRIEPFECRWWVSPTLLAACLTLWGLALLAIFLAALPVWLKLALVAGCLAYGGWGLQRQVLLRNPRKACGPRSSTFGWFMQRGEPEDADLRRMVRMILDRVQPD